jgi:hypothetical protein
MKETVFKALFILVFCALCAHNYETVEDGFNQIMNKNILDENCYLIVGSEIERFGEKLNNLSEKPDQNSGNNYKIYALFRFLRIFLLFLRELFFESKTFFIDFRS